MHSELPLNALEMFQRAVSRAYPSRTDLGTLKLEGTLAQAWLIVARVLGITTTELAQVLAPVMGVPLATDLEHVESEALHMVPFNFCQTHTVLPLRIESGVLLLATADPMDRNVIERLGFLSNRHVHLMLAPPDQIDDMIVVAFSREASRAASADVAKGAQAAVIDEHAVTKLGRALLLDAIAQRASDLHIQPFMGAAVVRIRVDGLMRRLTMLPEMVAVMLIRHIKARSGMESTNMQIPQDGRMSMVADGRDFDLRVSTLPASKGERLVIRFLDQGSVHHLSGAGFSLAALQTLRRAVARPAGMVILTGPTGSGKTSTLYAMLAEINRSTVNIITVENPVEYRVAGISQVEVNEKAGRTFAASLRSILRQDPDVILIGEIRDRETAEIAAAAALTGHLVLTTLHTSDALTAIPRLLNLGVEPSILADSLAVVVAQRLCRALCPHCKVAVTDPLTPEEKLFTDITHNRPGHRAVGCKACDFTGYRGRLPVVDIVEMNKRLRDAVSSGETRLANLESLREGGLRSLAGSGAPRVISGDTTVLEVMDTVGPGFWAELAQHYGSIFNGDMELPPPSHVMTGQGVLLMSTDAALADTLKPALEAVGLLMLVVANAEQAQACLRKDENIAFIIGDVPESLSLEQAVAHLSNNRLNIAWARLPALVLISNALLDQRAALIASGVMGELMAKPVDMQALLQYIRRSQAR
jgi:type IV pilus assembly protein PilB